MAESGEAGLRPECGGARLGRGFALWVAGNHGVGVVWKSVWQLLAGGDEPGWDDVYSGKGEGWTGGQAPQMLGRSAGLLGLAS